MDRQMFNGQEVSKDQKYFKEIGEMIQVVSVSPAGVGVM